MVACFIGHRKIDITEKLKNELYNLIIDLINNKNVDIFLFGSKSEFNDLCLDIVTEIKQKYPHIKRIYIRAEYQYIDKMYENYLLKYYDATYFPDKIKNAGKVSYIERNQIMIDKSEICVFYYDEKYYPKNNRNSGTKFAFDYAKNKKKIVVNLSRIHGDSSPKGSE